MRKKTNILLFLLTISAFILKGQQTAQFSNYLVNYFGQNPAAMGLNRCVDIKFGGKLQWLGFEGAPHYYFFSVTTPILKKNYSKVRHYAGGYILLDNQHIFSSTYIKLAYSLHHRISRGWYAGYGIFGGIKQVSVANIVSDPAINGAALHYPDLMPGIIFYNSKTMLGLGIEHIIPKRIKSLDNGRFRNQYYFTGSKKIEGGNYHDYMLSFNLKWGYLAPPALDLNAMLIKNKFNLGLGYRVGEAIILQLRFRINTLIIAYAFDFPLNRKRWFTTNSHELILGFSKCGSPQDKEEYFCPAYQ